MNAVQCIFLQWKSLSTTKIYDIIRKCAWGSPLKTLQREGCKLGRNENSMNNLLRTGFLLLYRYYETVS